MEIKLLANQPPKRFTIYIAAIPVVVCALAFFLNYQKNRWLDKKRAFRNPIHIRLAKGGSLRNLVRQLYQKNLIESPALFELWVKLTGSYPRFQAGHYRFEKPISPRSLIRDFTSGNVHHQTSLVLGVPEGSTIEDIFLKLKKYKKFEKEAFQRLVNDPGFLASLNIKGPTAEGFLYPATYRFYESFPKPKRIIKRMVQEFRKRLPETYQANAQKVGLTLNDAVIFASLIEKETARDEERELISEVIWNRLRQKMPLGIDAALIYGIQNYRGNITRKHLRDRKNPYNTRIHLGLPPTAICSPSLKSLNAVFAPAKTGAYYYVLIPNSGGRHHFSKTLNEHNEHVRKLVKSTTDRKMREQHDRGNRKTETKKKIQSKRKKG